MTNCKKHTNVFNGVCGKCLMPVEGVEHDNKGTIIKDGVHAAMVAMDKDGFAFDKPDKIEFDVDSDVVVERNYHGTLTYYPGKITKKTKTRFTVTSICFYDGSHLFSHNGNQYPKYDPSTISVSYKMLENTEENKDLVFKSAMITKLKNMDLKIGDIFENSNPHRVLISGNVDKQDLLECSQHMESVLKILRKYVK